MKLNDYDDSNSSNSSKLQMLDAINEYTYIPPILSI